MAEIPTPTSGYSAPSGSRPLGVTILALLELISGLLGMIGAFGVIALAVLFPLFGIVFLILGAITLILGLIALMVGWGLWSLKSWAWMAAIILNIISLIMAFVSAFAGSIDYIGIIISLIIILYLQQADIKSRFR